MSGNKPHILVIDDEFSICMAVCGLLELRDIPVAYALSAEEGIEFLAKNPNTDIVLLDIDLGAGITGVDALPLIKEKAPYTQVVMFTSQDRLDTGVECMKRGAIDYMTKPFNEDAFLRVAATAMEKKKVAQISDLYFDIIVHDLKNPLQCIVGAHEMLRDMLAGKTESIQDKLFDTAEQAIRNLQSMIGNMLGVSKFEKGTFSARRESFDLRGEIGAIMELYPSVQVQFSSDQPFVVNSDKDLVLRVLNNVVGNAIRFTLPSDPVFVKVDVDGDEQVRIAVTNTGSYIPEDLREAVFDKFAAVSPSAVAIRNQNFGLGLTFSKMAVEALGGRIWVESTQEIPETTFYFTVKSYREETVACVEKSL